MTRPPYGAPDTRPRVPADPAAYGYSRMRLRLWHGMTFRAWRSISRGELAHYRGDLRLGLYASITALSLGNSLLKGVSDLVHGRALAQVEVAPDPVFVLGYWRSGTTWLHQLLSADPRFCAPTALQVFMPETFLVLGPVMRPLQRVWLPRSRPMDNVALAPDSSEEDEVAMAVLGAPALLRRTAFGDRDAAAMADDLACLPEAVRQDWRDSWLGFLRRVQYGAPGRQMLLKSPAHAMRLPEILRLFPRARFVHITRDPYEVIVSNLKTAEAMAATQTLRRSMHARAVVEAAVLKTFRTYHATLERDRPLIPDGQYTRIRYEDLVQDTKTVIRDVYEDLDLGSFAAMEPGLDRIIAGRRGYRPNAFHIDTDLARRVDAAGDAFFRRYGYPMRAEQGGATD